MGFQQYTQVRFGVPWIYLSFPALFPAFGSYYLAFDDSLLHPRGLFSALQPCSASVSHCLTLGKAPLGLAGRGGSGRTSLNSLVLPQPLTKEVACRKKVSWRMQVAHWLKLLSILIYPTSPQMAIKCLLNADFSTCLSLKDFLSSSLSTRNQSNCRLFPHHFPHHFLNLCSYTFLLLLFWILSSLISFFNDDFVASLVLLLRLLAWGR